MTELNAAALRRLPLRTLRAWLEPGSERGRALRDELRPAAPDRTEALTHTLRRLAGLDAQIPDVELLAQPLRDLPCAERVAHVLRAGADLTLPDVFRLLAFLRGAHAHRAAADALGLAYERLVDADAHELPSADTLASWLRELSDTPEAPRARLRAAWAPGLAEARAVLRDLDASALRERVAAVAEGRAAVDPAGLAEARATVDRLEAEALTALSTAWRPRADSLATLAAALGVCDLDLARIRLRRRWEGCWPRIVAAGVRLVAARHPVVADALARDGRAVTPIDIEVGAGPLVVTGPNMGGKSVALELVMLSVVLARCAMPVPARKADAASWHRVAWIGAELEDRGAGLSSYATEVAELATVLRDPAGPGLLLVDELARGTNAREGAAMTSGLIRYLEAHEVTAVVVTHHDVTTPDTVPRCRVRGLDAVPEEVLRTRAAEVGWVRALGEGMDYRLVPDPRGSVPRDALRIAALAGIPDDLLDAALDSSAGAPPRSLP